MTSTMTNTLLRDIGCLVTMAPLAQSRRAHHVVKDDLGVVHNAWIAVESGKTLATGTGPVPARFESWPQKSCKGALVMPGLIDAHTHAIFGGTRSREFCMRLDGASYQDIAKAGGGIKSTVKATREASDAALEQLLMERLQTFLKYGVTTVEAKSGYGLNTSEELRLLRILKSARSKSPQTLSVTCLALHAVMPEFRTPREWVTAAVSGILPVVIKENLADAVDAFVERGYFEPEDVRPYLDFAKKSGLAVRLHADEFADSGGALLAAEYGALSADHLQHAPATAPAHMAAAGTVATLLPGTSLYTRIPFTNAQRFVQEGCAVALATDFNPGSSVVNNLPMMVTIGALHCGLSAAAAIVAVTFAAAKALGLEHRKGAIFAGYDADYIVHRMDSLDDFVADMGRSLPEEVWIKGVRIV